VQVFSVKPGDFALGSRQSRAAARALLAKRLEARKKVQVICSIPRPGADVGDIRIGDWIEGPDGALFRICNIPAGMTIQEAERIVAPPGWKPTVPPAKPERIRPPLKPEW
jgi:hypothetical protein